MSLLSRIKTSLFEWFESVFTSVIVLFIVYVLIAFPVLVQGESMYPNLETSDQLLIEKITPIISGYSRGDIVVLHPPEMDFQNYIKRVIALPGERVKIYNCRVQLRTNNGVFTLNEEAYLPKDVCTSGGKALKDGWEYSLKENEYMVLGDNRGNSQDSRVFGFITKDRIQGKAVSLFWPFSKFRIY
jgi:signal peptidase I